MNVLFSMKNVQEPLYLAIISTRYEADGENCVDVDLCSTKQDFEFLGFGDDEIEEINKLKVDEEFICEYYDGVSVKRIA